MRLGFWAIAPPLVGCAVLAVTSCNTDEQQTEAGLGPSVSASVTAVSEYDIPQVASMTVDGNLAEWASIVPISMADDPANGRGALNNSAAVKLAWNTTYLYLSYNVTDTELLADKTLRDDADIYTDDAVELFVDPQGDGAADLKMNATDYHFLANIRDAVGDKKGTPPPPPQTQDASYNAASFLSKAVLNGTLNGPGADVSYTVEQRISWADLGVTPTIGHFMRIDLAVGDKDAGGILEQFDWAGLASYNNPSGWKEVQLVSGDVTPPVISAVVSAPGSVKAAVMWKTDELSNSSVDYGPTTGYGSTTPVQASPVTAHTVLVTGLAAQQVYHYRVRSVDPAGNSTVSGDGTFSTSPAGTLAAFPGAQGGGATAAGGRGGTVIEVTNLSDAGGGSLRACMEASGPRTCVIRVAGTINLLSAIRVKLADANLTVAAQTAPGGGIMIKGKTNLENQLQIEGPDVVLQYLRVRTGWNATRFANDGGGTPLRLSDNAVRFMADHLSLSWNTNDNVGIWDHPDLGGEPHDISLAHVLIAEATQGHSTAMVTGSSNNDAGARLMTNIDVHHSMTANHTHRAPHLKNMSSRLVNNIFYNNDRSSTQLKGGVNVDIIGNVYKQGGNPQDMAHEINGYTNSSSGGNAVIGSPSIYLLGNKGWNQASPSGNQWLLAAKTLADNGAEVDTIPTAWRRGGPLAVSGVPIVVDPANNLEAILTGSKGVGASSRLDCNGNWVANRDAADTRVMSQYASGTGNYPRPTLYEEAAAFGWPTMAPGTACTDADHDGMADTWETANGLNPASAADGNTAAANGSGYTNLDMYLAGMPAR